MLKVNPATGGLELQLGNLPGTTNSFANFQGDAGSTLTAASPTDTASFTSSDKSTLITGNSGTDKLDFTTPPSVAVSALSVDWKLGQVFYKTISGSSTFTFANIVDGKTIVLAVTTTGAFTAAFPAGIKWASGSQPVQTGTGTDVYTFVRINGVTYASAVQAMA